MSPTNPPTYSSRPTPSSPSQSASSTPPASTSTSSSSLQSVSSDREFLHQFIDLVFAWFWTGPLVVLYWRGTFNYISHYLFTSGSSPLPDNHEQSAYKLYKAFVLYSTSVTVKIVIDLVKHLVNSGIDDVHPSVISITKFSIIYWDALFSTCMWVGGFNLLYGLPGLQLVPLLSILFTASCLLLLLRGFDGIISPPFAISLNDHQSVLKPKGYLGLALEDGLFRLVLDITLSYLFVHFLVICCWWGLWELENNFIMGKMEIIYKDVEAWDSVVLSMVLTVALVPAQRYMSRSRSRDTPMVVESAVVGFIALLASVNYWRGVWSLLDFYFLPNLDLVTNLLVSHVVGFVLLSLFYTSASLCFSSTRDSVEARFLSCDYWSRYLVKQRENDPEGAALLPSTLQ